MATREGTLLGKYYRVDTDVGERYFKIVKYDIVNFVFDIRYLDNLELSTISWELLEKCTQVGG